MFLPVLLARTVPAQVSKLLSGVGSSGDLKIKVILSEVLPPWPLCFLRVSASCPSPLLCQRLDLSLGAVCREIGLGGFTVASPSFQEVAPLSTATANTDFTLL